MEFKAKYQGYLINSHNPSGKIISTIKLMSIIPTILVLNHPNIYNFIVTYFHRQAQNFAASVNHRSPVKVSTPLVRGACLPVGRREGFSHTCKRKTPLVPITRGKYTRFPKDDKNNF